MRSNPVAKDATIFARDFNALRSDARGGAALSAHQTLGKLALPTNPSDGQTATLVINGTSIAVRFKNTLAAANDVKIAADAAATSSNLFNFLTNPQMTNSTQMAASAGDQVLFGYLSYNVVTTTTYLGSVNRVVNPILTSFSCSTTVSSGVYTANTMALFVQGGTAYVNGTEVKFAGGLSPTVTAPVSNPRIDVLTLDSSGTLAWTTGSENASPSAPTYPANKIPIVEVYNAVGETSINDNENQTSGQGYVLYDVRGILQVPFNPGALPYNLVPSTDGAYDLGSASFEFGSIYVKNGIFLGGASINSALTVALTAGPAFTQGQAAALYPYQSDGGTLFDAVGGYSGANTGSFSVGSNSNRILVVFAVANGTSATITGVTYNSVALTQIGSRQNINGNTGFYVFYLIAPATGSHSLAITTSAGTANCIIFSYYNAKQSGQPDASTIDAFSNTGGSHSVTTVAPGCLVVTAMSQNVLSSSTGKFANAGNANGFGYADSGQVPDAGTSITASNSTTNAVTTGIGMVSIAPFTAPVLSAVPASSVNSLSQFYNKYTAFVGIALASISAGQLGAFVTAGVTTVLSGLSPTKQYYLTDTDGTIGTTAGTNTRKVGIAISSTDLLITNNW